MKILHISNRDSGGAGKACVRLHQGLLECGVDSNLLVLEQYDMSIRKSFKFIPPMHNKFERIKRKTQRILSELHLYAEKDRYRKSEFLKNRPKHFGLFSFPFSPFDITQHPLYIKADIINLHWTTRFLDYNSFFRNNSKKIVWTLHDMNPFTGGCHYADVCNGFEKKCEKCPQLINTTDETYANKNLQAKKKSLKDISYMTIVAPSKWMLEQSKKSTLFRNFHHEYIPYGLHQNIFKPMDKKYSRELLGLPLEKKIILFVATLLDDERKGFKYLQNAIDQLGENSGVVLCAVGNSKENSFKLNNVIHLANINDERLMSTIYSAADLFVIPSLEDNLPNTVLESLLCGTPVLGFPTGGIVDMIDDPVNGILCEGTDSESILKGIKYFLSNADNYRADAIRINAVKKYSLETQAKAYISLYKEILK